MMLQMFFAASPSSTALLHDQNCGNAASTHMLPELRERCDNTGRNMT
jgi:hypothetical protein